MIPEAAVEAAAKAAYEVKPVELFGRDSPVTWEQLGDSPPGQSHKDQELRKARLALEAAAPHMLNSRGDGDYRPGWDDRKTLSGLWQEHAPLPDEGLSERVYEALIEVAAWGYQRRMDEEL